MQTFSVYSSEKSTEVSKEHIAFIHRLEEHAKQGTSSLYFMLVSSLAYSSVLIMEAMCS